MVTDSHRGFGGFLIECAGAQGLLERVCFLREGEPRDF